MFLAKVPSRMLSSGAKSRVPAIRFRHGASRQQDAGATSPAKQPGQGQGQKREAQPAEAIYDFQLPLRFRRMPLSEEEIACINRGGPE